MSTFLRVSIIDLDVSLSTHVTIGEGAINCLPLLCIYIVAHLSKESVDVLGIASVSQYDNILKGLLPCELWKQSSLCKVEGIRALDQVIHLNVCMGQQCR